MQNRKDPACGMTVHDDMDVAETGQAGQAHLLCSKSCRESFETEPERIAIQADVNGGTHRKGETGGT